MSLDATRWAWTVCDISPTQRLVLLRLSDRANKQQIAWPSITSIAKDTSLGRRTVIRALERLIAKELIALEGRFGGQSGQSSVYRILIGPRIAVGTVSPLRARVVVSE